MSRSLLGRDPLWFDSSKYLPIASDHVSLSKGVFLMTYVNRKWTFCILMEWFGDLRHSKTSFLKLPDLCIWQQEADGSDID